MQDLRLNKEVSFLFVTVRCCLFKKLFCLCAWPTKDEVALAFKKHLKQSWWATQIKVPSTQSYDQRKARHQMEKVVGRSQRGEHSLQLGKEEEGILSRQFRNLIMVIKEERSKYFILKSTRLMVGQCETLQINHSEEDIMKWTTQITFLHHFLANIRVQDWQRKK